MPYGFHHLGLFLSFRCILLKVRKGLPIGSKASQMTLGLLNIMVSPGGGGRHVDNSKSKMNVVLLLSTENLNIWSW